MKIPGMLKPFIASMLKGVEIKFDAEAASVIVRNGDTEAVYSFEQIEEMINNGKIEL